MSRQHSGDRRIRGDMVGIRGYDPSDEAVMDVARNCERSYVRLNRDITLNDAVANLAMREMMGIAASTAMAEKMSRMVPEASNRLNAIAEEHSEIALSILRGWRR